MSCSSSSESGLARYGDVRSPSWFWSESQSRARVRSEGRERRWRVFVTEGWIDERSCDGGRAAAVGIEREYIVNCARAEVEVYIRIIFILCGCNAERFWLSLPMFDLGG